MSTVSWQSAGGGLWSKTPETFSLFKAEGQINSLKRRNFAS